MKSFFNIQNLVLVIIIAVFAQTKPAAQISSSGDLVDQFIKAAEEDRIGEAKAKRAGTLPDYKEKFTALFFDNGFPTGFFREFKAASLSGNKSKVETLLKKLNLSKKLIEVIESLRPVKATDITKLKEIQDSIESLIKEGADVNTITARDDTPLTLAAEMGKKGEPIAFLILNSGAQNPGTAFSKAVISGASGLVEKLIRLGITPNTPDKGGLTPLHRAAIGGKVEMATTLLDNGADINAGDAISRHTPLMSVIAFSRGKTAAALLPIITLLLNRRADTKLRDNEGKTALDLAKEWNAPKEIIALLEERATY